MNSGMCVEGAFRASQHDELLSEANVSSAAPTACTLWVAAMSTGNFGSLAVRKLTDTAEQTPNSFGV